MQVLLMYTCILTHPCFSVVPFSTPIGKISYSCQSLPNHKILQITLKKKKKKIDHAEHWFLILP